MGNDAVNKALPAIDMLLVLVVVLFSMAGLLRSLNGMSSEPNDPNFGLVDEVEKRKELLHELEQQLSALGQCKDTVQDLEAYRDRILQQKDHIDQAEEQFNEVVKQVSNISIQHQIRQMTQIIADLEKKKQQLEQVLKDLEVDRIAYHRLMRELERIQAEIAKLEAEIEKKGGQAWPGGSGYKGPYVLLECDDKGIVIYPGVERLPLDAPEGKIKDLKERIRKKGAVLLLARPSSFEKSFDHFKPILAKFVKEENKKGKDIVLTYWPLDDMTDIQKYIPKGD